MPGKSTFAKTLNRSDGNRTPRRSFPSLFENVDSATPGKPYVQNDMRVGWQNGRKNQLMKLYIDKRHGICSQVLFYDPNFDCLVEPLTCCISETHPPAYQPITMGQYLEDTFNRTLVYRDYGELAN